MEQLIEKPVINSDITNQPTKEDVLEFNVAKEVKNIVELDIKQLEYYEQLIRSLHLELSFVKNIEKLDEIESKFIILKDQLKEVIESYKNLGIDVLKNDVSNPEIYKSLGHYKDEMENQFIMAKITHQSFCIPPLIEKIIWLEISKEKIEQRIDEKKIITKNPELKWDVVEANNFALSKETAVIGETIKKQDEFLLQLIEGIITIDFDEQITVHIDAIELLLNNLKVTVKAFNDTSVTSNNIMGLSIASGITNTLIRGLIRIISLENSSKNINEVTYAEEVKNRLNDYSLSEAVNSDSLDQIKIAKIEMVETLGSFASKYPTINNIIKSIDEMTDILDKKQIVIETANYKIKSENEIKRFVR